MTTRPFVLLVLTLGMLQLSSCASRPPATPAVLQPTGKEQWTAQAGAFHIDLALGASRSRGENLPPSRYHVTYRDSAGEKRIETESFYSSEYFADPVMGKFRPAQALASDGGDALVIDEQIPNDCCATNNYTYIAPDAQGKLTATYFALPERPTHDLEMGDLPRVTRIRGQVIEYRYQSGATGSVKVSLLKTLAHPVPAG